MTQPLCVVCSRPLPDHAQLCPACTLELEQALGDVPALADELDVTLTRQSRLGDGVRGADRPVPYDTRASEVTDMLRSTLVGWVRMLAADEWPDDTLESMGRWLLARIGQLRVHPAADEAHSEVTYAVAQGWHAVDRPPELWYAGPCECGTDLYARPGAAVVRCRERDCRRAYDVAERRQWLLDACEDTLAHAELIARGVTTLGQPVTSASIRGYAFRGRIAAHGTDAHGRPLYRIGDVLDRVAEQARKKAS